MAHFAQLDENNKVINVIVIDNLSCFDKENKVECEEMGIDACKSIYGEDTIWVQTSYNSNKRYNYAGIGYTYDSTADAFIPPQTYPSWVLNSSYKWEAPIPKPQDTETHTHYWDEDLHQSDNTEGWVQISIS